ncbi:hypothetical protein ACW5R3_00470 [Bizionia sp. KMM 8389]
MKNIFVIILLCLLSCQETESNLKESRTENIIETIINKSDIDALDYTEYVLDANVVKSITGWAKYDELGKILEDVKVANLSFFKSNKSLVATLNNELKTTVPETVSSPLIDARILAIETKMYKLENQVNLSNPTKGSLLEAVEELLTAYSNLNLQLNKQLEKRSQRIQRPE